MVRLFISSTCHFWRTALHFGLCLSLHEEVNSLYNSNTKFGGWRRGKKGNISAANSDERAENALNIKKKKPKPKQNEENRKRERDKNGIRVRTVNNSFLCFSCLALFLLLEFWQEYKKTKKRRKEWRKEEREMLDVDKWCVCHLPYIYAIARDKVGAAAAAVVVWRQRRSRPFSFAASFAYHLAIATLLLCAGWLAGWLAPLSRTSGRMSREESRHIRFGQSAAKDKEKRKKME